MAFSFNPSYALNIL